MAQHQQSSLWLHNTNNINQQQQQQQHYKSEATEQLDKLLAGLDKLSETLPDLSGDQNHQPQQQQQLQQQSVSSSTTSVLRKFPAAGSWQDANTSVAGSSDQHRVNNSSEARVRETGGAALNNNNSVKMRSYEDDLDYALEKELVIKGPERRVLVGTDNYSDHYNSDVNNKPSLASTHQPYHTRNDSKPFSYIR